MRIPLAAKALVAMAITCCCEFARQFSVAVFRSTEVPVRVVVHATAAARLAFGAAGIESRWIVCGPEGCETELPSDGCDLELCIVPRLRTPLPGIAGGLPAGYVTSGPSARRRGYAFYDAAEAVAARTTRPVHAVLGCILIHESGHLLGLGHARRGAMREGLAGIDVDEATRGRAFDWLEAKQLREGVDRLLDRGGAGGGRR